MKRRAPLPLRPSLLQSTHPSLAWPIGEASWTTVGSRLAPPLLRSPSGHVMHVGSMLEDPGASCGIPCNWSCGCHLNHIDACGWARCPGGAWGFHVTHGVVHVGSMWQMRTPCDICGLDVRGGVWADVGGFHVGHVPPCDARGFYARPTIGVDVAGRV
eukprot:jgi/Botrbrau1/21522/Bobra.174_2s0025.1